MSIPIEVRHAAHATLVVARLPGAKPASVRVDVRGSSLFIDAEGADGGIHAVVPMALDVDEDRTEFRFANGVLHVFLPGRI
jgi:HSP20 family molecular chaperone IbpA